MNASNSQYDYKTQDYLLLKSDKIELLKQMKTGVLSYVVNLLAPELFFLILAHSVYKMWII